MLPPRLADRWRWLGAALGCVCTVGAPVAADQAVPSGQSDFGLLGGPEVLWVWQYRAGQQDGQRLLHFAYLLVDDVASAEVEFAKPRGPSGVLGGVARAAVRGANLHVFFADGTHLRYHAKGSAVERKLPDDFVPPAVTGDEIPDLLYALVPASVAREIREPEPTTRPVFDAQPAIKRETESDTEARDLGPQTTSPAAAYAIVRYERGAWHRDRSAPEWLTPDLVSADGLVWLAAANGVCHLLARAPAERVTSEANRPTGNLVYVRSDGDTWTVPEPVPEVGPDGLAAATVHQGQFLLLARGPMDIGPRLRRRTEAGFEVGPVLADSAPHGAGPVGRRWTVSADRVAGGALDRDSVLSIGLWSLVDGSLLREPAPVEALIPKLHSWVEARLPPIAYGLLSALLAVVFWRRRESLAIPAVLPDGQTTARHPRRLAAFLIDTLITLPMWVVIMAPAVPPTLEDLSVHERNAALQEMQATPEFLARWLIAAGVFVTYATVFETFMGATPGKRILRCRVVDVRGQPCRFGAVAVRNLIRLVEMFYLFQLMPAIILILLTRNRQRLGDLLAGTLVVEGTARYGNADS